LPEPFRCEVSYVDDGAVIVIEGEVDLATAPRFQSDAETALARGVTELAIDLALATFIDSSGLGVLVVLEREARERDITFRIVAVSPVVQRALEVTGLAAGFGLSG
jgi:anti-sigma B factor antagonist